VSLPFQPFKTALTDCRAVEIPPDLDADARAHFVEAISAAVRRQADLAEHCDAVLRITGEPREETGRLIIPHEPATPADPGLIVSAEQRPDIDEIWWLTWAALGALRGAHEARVLHAGLQLGSLLRDETGRLKLSDFGIASVFETACGIENRRFVVCEVGEHTDASGRPLSAAWLRATEDETREYGWISTHFPPELLQDQGRANFKTDQFSLGVLLFLWATGTHPYGAALSDPSLMFYFTLEPYALEDERADWRDCFKRHGKGLAQSIDQPILAWSGLVRQLLASEAEERYPKLADAEQAAADYAPGNWSEASGAISTALTLLDDGQVDACLGNVAQWVDEASLPALWREPLTAFVGRVESQRAIIAQRKALAKRLDEGERALDRGELEQVRTIVNEVAAAPESDDALRQRAKHLLKLCEEQEELIRSGADELAREYIQSARDALAQHEFNEARLCLNAILQDPANPQTRLEQAERMLAEVNQTEERLRRQEADYAAASSAREEGSYEQAAETLQALLEDQPLSESITEKAAALLEQVRTALARRAEYAQALDDAHVAWERADPQTAEELLASIPFDLDDPQVVGRRGELAEACEHLRAALQHKDRAAELSEGGDEVAALAEARQAAAVPSLPTPLRHELTELIRRWEQIIEDRRQAALKAARAALDQAHAAWERADPVAAEESLAGVPADIDEPELVGRRAELTGACERLRAALANEAHAAELLEAGDVLGTIVEVHKAAEVADLPATLRDELDGLAQRCEQMIEEQRRVLVEQALSSLADAQRAFETGDVDACRTLLESVFVVAESLPSEDHGRARQLHDGCERFGEALQLLDRARQRVERDDFDGAVAVLDGLDSAGLPARVAEGAAELRDNIERARRAFEQRQREQLGGRLARAAETIAEGRLDAADPALKEIEGSAYVSDEMRARISELRGALAQQRGVVKTLRAAETALDRDAGDEAAKLLTEHLPAELPDWAAQRAARIRQGIEQLEQRKRQAAIDKAGAALNAAATALERADHASAKGHLRQAAKALSLDASLAERHRELAGRAAQLETWMPKVEALEAALKRDETAAVYRSVSGLLQDESIPQLAAARLKSLHKRATTRIATRQKEISAELDALTGQLEQRGRRFRYFPERVQALAADPLATKEQKSRTAELLQQFEALPAPRRRPVLPIAVAASVVVAAAAAVAWYATRAPTQPEGPRFPPAARDVRALSLNANASGHVDLEYEVAAQAAVEPFTIRFMHGRDRDAIPDAAEELYTVDGDVSPGPHVVELPGGIDAVEGGVIAALIDTSNWSIEEASGGNNLVVFPVPRREPQRGDVSVVDLSFDAAARQIHLRYRVVGELQVASFPIVFFWDRNDNRELDEGDERLSSADGNATPNTYAVSLPQPIPEDQAGTLGVVLDVDDNDLANNTAFAAVARHAPDLQAQTRMALRDHPPPQTAPVNLDEAVRAASPELAQALPKVLDAVGKSDAMRADVELVRGAWEPSADQALTASQQVQVSAAGALLAARCTLTFDESSQGWVQPRWSLVDREDLKTIAEWLRQEALHRVAALSDEGALAGAWTCRGAVEPVLASLRQSEPFAGLGEFAPELPPAWQPIGGYQPVDADRDAKVGYPTALESQTDGQRLLLVYVYPNDPLWDAVGAGRERTWKVFYIGAGELSENVPQEAQAQTRMRLIDTFSEAGDAAAQAPQCDLPTRAEWMLAALKLWQDSRATDFVGGAYEWCYGDDGQPWVCGGPPLRALPEKLHGVVPSLKADASRAEIRAWLEHPLASQARQYGDGLTGVRTILRVYPAGRP
jgi:hypothetical protein